MEYIKPNFVIWLPAVTEVVMKLLSYYQVTTRRAVYYNVNIEARMCNHLCRGKVGSIIQPVCAFVTSVIQRVMRIRHINLLAPEFYI
jgi:hypothetical protein